MLLAVVGEGGGMTMMAVDLNFNCRGKRFRLFVEIPFNMIYHFEFAFDSPSFRRYFFFLSALFIRYCARLRGCEKPSSSSS